MEATETEIKTEQAREETPLEAFASICTVLVIGLFALPFIFQNFEIPSSSMEKTLLVGDHVLVDRITLAPRTAWAPFIYYRDVRRGDIIVFFKPGEPDLYLVKRVIGVPATGSTCATESSSSTDSRSTSRRRACRITATTFPTVMIFPQCRRPRRVRT